MRDVATISECVADCPRCHESAYIVSDHIDTDHDCPAAGRPVTVVRCEECNGSGYLRAHRGPCGHFCGCYECETCSRTGSVATILPGPPIPADLDHPFNMLPSYAAPNHDVDKLQAERMALDLGDVTSPLHRS